MNRKIVLLFALVFALVQVDSLAQDTENHPVGILATPTQNQVDSLLDILRNQADPNWIREFRRAYFHEVHSPRILDLVIYIDQDGGIAGGASPFVGQGLDKARKRIIKTRTFKNQILRGEREIYVIFLISTSKPSFSAYSKLLYNPLCGPVVADEKNVLQVKNPTIKVRYTALSQHQDPLLRKAINAFTNILKVKVDEAKESPNNDTTKSIPLMLLNYDSTFTEKLYIGMTKFQLTENSWNRISVCGDGGMELVKNTTAVVHNFGNASYSRIRLGVATGLTRKRFSDLPEEEEEDDIMNGKEGMMGEMEDMGMNDDDSPEEEPSITFQSKIRPNIYIYGTYYLRNIAPPQWFNWGLTLGTSISPAGLFNDIYGAVTLDSVNDGLPSLQVGYSWYMDNSINEKKPAARSGWFFGFGFDL